MYVYVFIYVCMYILFRQYQWRSIFNLYFVGYYWVTYPVLQLDIQVDTDQFITWNIKWWYYSYKWCSYSVSLPELYVCICQGVLCCLVYLFIYLLNRCVESYLFICLIKLCRRRMAVLLI
jgi:hypothetical protein